MEKKRFAPETMKYVKYLSMPAVHPLGQKTVYVITEAEEENGTFIPCIHEVAHETKQVREVTFMEKNFKEEAFKEETHSERTFTKISVKSPKYSPDGTCLAYLSDESGNFQIYLKKEGENGGTKVTTLRHGITCFDWSHDGTMLVFTAPLWQQEIKEHIQFKEMSTEEKVNWQEEKEWAPLEITDIDYKHDSCHGVRNGSFNHVGIVNPVNGLLYLVTEEDMECTYPSFSKEDSMVAFYGRPYKGVYASDEEVFVADLSHKKCRQVTQERKLFLSIRQQPLFSADGRYLYTAAWQTFDDNRCMETILQIDVKTGEAVNLLPMAEDSVTVGVHGEPVSRTVYGEASPCFLIDYRKRMLYFTNSWRGWQNLYRMPLDGERKIQAVIENEYNVHGFNLPIENKIIFLGGKPDTIAELYSLDLKKSEIQRLTFSNNWLDDYELGKTEMVWVETTDKKAKIEVWIVHPAKEEPGKLYPAVLDIHGGPECSYVSDFWHEFQAVSGAGMYCIYTNPRGSTGYGADFLSNDYSWGNEAYDDLLLAVEAAVSRANIDSGRIGVTGGSYGGYMTNKFIGTTKRFRAAVTQRSLVNTATSYGTGDIGFISKREKDVSKVKMLDFLTKRARSSLIRHVDQMKTPLLILHGYQDYRCTFEQAEQLFIAMKERNTEVPVRLVMFPEENHEITRSGKLHNQIRHLKELTDWFVKYLKEDGKDE